MIFNIKFRALTIRDAEFINKLRSMQDMENLIGGSKRFISLERETEWVKSLLLNDNNSVMYFAICEKGNDTIIGYTSISEIDYRSGSCFWSGIKLSPDFSGKGYGFEAELLILKYVFEELRMVRCKAEGLEEHVIALSYMAKAGFIKEGLMRKHVYKSGGHKNVWLLSMTDDDYVSTKAKYDL
jgi:RimJ/RimL family protein N-acetyltransferase